jgi:signal transduction histidine kinase
MGMGSKAQKSKPSKAKASQSSDLKLFQLLHKLSVQFRKGRDVDKVFRRALQMALDHFAAPEGCVADFGNSAQQVTVSYAVPDDSDWDCALITDFLRGKDIRVPSGMMLARIRRHGRMWGALALRRPRADFAWDARRAFSTIVNTAMELAERMDNERIRDVRSRIDRKIMVQICAKDLFYQILRGIRSLTSYDHSAAVLTFDEDMQTLEIVAEQIAWQKAKSQKVGLQLPVDSAVRELLIGEAVYGFDRLNSSWHDWTKHGASPVANLLDYNRSPHADLDERIENAILCATLITRNRILGVLKVASNQPGAFQPHEAELVSSFLPYALIALQNSQRTESLEQKVLAAERKTAMADLARGVSHDVNNTLGAVLPLVQQLREEIDQGEFDVEIAGTDLMEIERSLQVCRRIFNGMLRFARGATQNVGDVDLTHAIEVTLAILREGMERRNIEVQVALPPKLPPVQGVLSDIEQLLLNVLSNARDAMPQGGVLTIKVEQRDTGCVVTVMDTGCGIPAADLPKIQEPFFTTKDSGNGLGLAICRSILSQMQGRMHIESSEGSGTRVELLLPLASSEVIA